MAGKPGRQTEAQVSADGKPLYIAPSASSPSPMDSKTQVYEPGQYEIELDTVPVAGKLGETGRQSQLSCTTDNPNMHVAGYGGHISSTWMAPDVDPESDRRASLAVSWQRPLNVSAPHKEWWMRADKHKPTNGLSRDSCLAGPARIKRVKELWRKQQQTRRTSVLAAQGSDHGRFSVMSTQEHKKSRSISRFSKDAMEARCSRRSLGVDGISPSPESLHASNMMWSDPVQANSTGKGVRTQIWPNGVPMHLDM